MASTLPLATTCCTPCSDPVVAEVPGPEGEPGAAGAAGADGDNAFTTFTSLFTMPAELGSGAAVVADSSWMAVNQVLYCARVDGSVRGYLKVTAITDATNITLMNLEDTANDAYLDNSAPGATFTAGSKICAGGVQGPEGPVSSGAAGGDLKGTYPNPKLSLANDLGDIVVGNGTDATNLFAGTSGQMIAVDGTAFPATVIGYKTIVPITGGTDVDTDRVVRLSAATGLPIPLASSRMSVKDAGGAGTVVADARSSVSNARGADAIDLQTSRNAVTQVASGTESVLLGGRRNTAAATQCVIVGGDTNSINAAAQEAFIGGGAANSIGALGERAVIGGGDTNQVTGSEGTVAGGNQNIVSGTQGAICGGDSNQVTATEGFVGGGNTNVCGDANGTIGGGSGNVTSGGACTIAGGSSNLASGILSTIPGGLFAAATHYGELAHASGFFTAQADAQTMELLMRRATSDATPSELFLDGASLRATIAAGQTWVFEIYLVGRSSAGVSAAWRATGAIQNIAGTTTVTAAAVVASIADGTGATWGVVGNFAVTASDPNDALVLTVTGAGATNIRWVAHLRIVQVSF